MSSSLPDPEDTGQVGGGASGFRVAEMTNDPASGQPSIGSQSQGSVEVTQMEMGHLRSRRQLVGRQTFGTMFHIGVIRSLLISQSP